MAFPVHFRAITPILALGALLLPLRADEIIKTDGSKINGQITGVSGGQVAITIGTAKSVVYVSDIKSITMKEPVALPKNATPEQTVAALEPVVKQYAGLPAEWVLDDMSKLADAYDAQDQGAKSAQIYTQLKQLYPNNAAFQEKAAGEAAVGAAKQQLKAGRAEDALAAMQPLVDQANKNVAPSPTQGRLFAKAFLVYGQALQAEKKYPQALEAYLTVKTMFYQNPALVAQADQLAQTLRTQNPGVAVD